MKTGRQRKLKRRNIILYRNRYLPDIKMLEAMGESISIFMRRQYPGKVLHRKLKRGYLNKKAPEDTRKSPPVNACENPCPGPGNRGQIRSMAIKGDDEGRGFLI